MHGGRAHARRLRHLSRLDENAGAIVGDAADECAGDDNDVATGHLEAAAVAVGEGHVAKDDGGRGCGDAEQAREG
eukprot:2253390-Pleurochrysis_carterae.AAC.1